MELLSELLEGHKSMNRPCGGIFVRKKGKHIISFILALSMLLSGMCFEYTKADSFLEYASFNGAEASIEPCHTAISHGEICTSEMLGIRNVSNVRQFVNRSICTRRVVRASLELFGADDRLHLYSDFYTAAGSIQYPKLCLQAVVLNYIHNKDGKKRI